MSNTIKTAEEFFTVDDIEDVRVIIIAKGKHFAIVAKGDREEAKLMRIAMGMAMLQDHFVVSTALEDLRDQEDEPPEPDMNGFDYKTEIQHRQSEAKKLK